MKSKITLFLVLIMLPVMTFMGNVAFAQTVTGTTGNTGCSNSGFITAGSTGLGTTPEYQLLKSGVVIAPLPGDASRFATSVNASFKFEALENGNYTVKARAASGQTIYTSSTIVVKDGYTNMVVAAQAKTANCSGGTGVISANLSGGKAPFVYKIALQSSPNTYLQTSASTSALTFAFNPLVAGLYTVSVTDACNQTVTGATSISDPTIKLTDIKVGTYAYPTRDDLSCTEKIKLRVDGGFRYNTTNTILSAADAALFTWKIKYKGQLYGKDTDGDGYADLNGAAFTLTTTEVVMPLIATRLNVAADIDNIKIVVIDLCGKSVDLSVIDYNKQISYITLGNCGGTAMIKSLIGRGLDCLPMVITLTNRNNPLEKHDFTVTESSQTFTSGALIPGATYNVTYKDGEGYTTDLYKASSSSLFFNPASNFLVSQYVTTASVVSLNYLNYGDLTLKVDPIQSDDILTYTVKASNNPLVPVNYSYSAPLDSFQNRGTGFPILPSPNATDPSPYWPKGNYTLEVTAGCGVAKVDVVVQGRTATLNKGTITPICGGFNYVMNGTFDLSNAYQAIVVSGPSSVGQVKDLASVTASLPFTGLSYGTYVFGLRIKGGTTNVLTETVTYDPGTPVKIERARTGGYVCTEGAQDGTLTITASSNSPAPNDALTYAISKDGGKTYLPNPYQSSNMFTGLAKGTYSFKVKDGCGNEVTETAQIGVASAPIASADGLVNPTLCKLNSGTVQLDVDIINGTYTWTGPGITALNKNLKSPVINYSDLALGANNYTCTIVLGAPCNVTNDANLTITASSPVVKISNPAPVCAPDKVDLTNSAVTSGSDKDLLFSYYSDSAATLPLSNPDAIDVSGIYYIKAKNSISCETISPVTVVVSPLPVATITYNTTYCKRGTAAVTQTGTIGGSYTGDTGLVINATTGLIDLASSSVGTHTVTYTFSNGTCTDTAVTTVTINPTILPAVLAPVMAQCSVEKIDAPTLTDPCAGTVTATTNTVFPITKKGTTDVSWVFNYGNGYTQNIIQKVDIADTTAPIVPVLANITGECSVTPETPVTNDNCDNGFIAGTTSTVFPITKQGTTEIIWTFEDSSGNSSVAKQNVIINDVTPPLIPVLADITGKCSVTPVVPTTTDNCAGTITGVTTTVFPITAVGKTVVTWTFDDGNGNSVIANQNVIITEVALVGAVSTSCAVDGLGYTVTLNVSGEAPFTATGTGAPGIWTGTTWLSDAIPAGTAYNVSVQDSYACNTLVVADIAPTCCVFEVVSPTFPTTVIACYDQLPTAVSLTKAEFEALGNGDGRIGGIPCGVIEITASNDADPGCNGNIIRTYTVTEYADTNNNKVRDLGEDIVLDSATFTQTFIIDKADFVMPANTGKTITCPASIVTPQVPEVKDNCGNILVVNTPVISAIPSCNGDVTYTYTFTDCTGNAHDWIYTYTIDNTVAPTGNTPADLLVQCIDDVPAANINAVTNTVANCNGSIDITVADTNNGGRGCKGNPYIVTRTFTLTDCSGLTTNLVQKITVEDTTAPVFVETLPTNIVVDCASEIPGAATLTATDNCSTADVAYQEIKVNGSCSGNYELQRTWTATDSCGNETAYTQIITIVDTTAPVFVESLPEVEVNATCETIPSIQTLTATDTCGTATVDYTETKVDGYCSSKYDLIRTWVASDDCGNQNRFTQTIHVSCLPEIYNAISPNGDGLNDTFTIGGIDCYPNNNLRIYNRYGVLVYEKQGYDNVTNPFEGFSDGRATLKRGDKLPTGTYFYTLEYSDDNKNKVEKAGYLYINNN